MKLILDTDFSSDVDDLGDVAIAAALHRLGHVDLVAVTACVDAGKTPGAISAALKWWGAEEGVSIGAWKGGAFDPGIADNKTWRDYLYDNYDRNGVGLSATVEDATTTLRRALVNADEKEVVIVATGPMNQIQALMESEADEVSDLTGLELLEAKCRGFWPVIGIFPTGTEWNAEQHPTSAHYVAANWPSSVPLYWVGIELGNEVTTGGTIFSSKPDGDLMKEGFRRLPASGYTRPAWGQLGVIAAATGNADFGLVRGTATFDGGTGANTWVPFTSANQFYLTLVHSAETYEAQLNTLLGAEVTDDPLLTTWGSSRPIIKL